MADGRVPISSSRIATGDIARHSFAVVRRGFDSDEVRAYLQAVSRSMEEMEEREQQLRAELAEAEERAAHPVVDEATLTSSLGQHSAQIIRHAHEEAARIVAEAQESAVTLRRDTQSQADELQMRTETSSAERVVEVELLVANAQQEAREESARVLAAATAEGDDVIARAKDEGRALLEQVQEARRRVLADLASKRRTISMQIEQLRAARDEMAASVHGVRDRVDGILEQLDRTEDEARAAALAVGDQLRLHGAPDEPHDQDAPGAAAGEGTEGDEGATGRAPTSETEVVGDDVDGAGAPSVDELFARIRAGSETDGEAGAGGGAGGGSAKGGAGETPPPAGAAAPAEAPTQAVPVGGEAEDAEPGPAVDGPDAELVARRNELLAPLSSKLSRAVKRTLGDDQNRLLDRLRSAPALGGDELLGSEDEHLAMYAEVARGVLGEAYAAGTTFGGAKAAATPTDFIDESSAGLAHTIVTMLRRRIADGDDDGGDRVGAAFREWRGERVERLAGDHATQAFSAGAVAAAGVDGKVRWVVTSVGGCSDCEDNALAGTVSAPEAFPTGHAYPPAHPGCRCLVAPADD
jgi:DivIVA domain-containing protein